MSKQFLSTVINNSELRALEHTTYGVEVERYSLNFADQGVKGRFITEYKSAIAQDFHQETEQALGIRTHNARPKAELCCIKDKNGHAVMTVRLDAEKEFAVRDVQDEYLGGNRYNIEFISEGSGIKMHKEFMADCAKEADSDMRKAVDGFHGAVNALQSGQNPPIEVNGFKFEFSDVGASALSQRNALQHERDGSKGVAVHVTHSLLLPREMTNEYMIALAQTLAVEKSSMQHAHIHHLVKQGQPVAALKSALGTKDDAGNITGSRNANQPLFKCPAEYLIPTAPADSKTPSGYLQAALRGEVLQPISNRLDYLMYDVAGYKGVRAALSDKITYLQSELESMRALGQPPTSQTAPEQQEDVVHGAELSSVMERIRVKATIADKASEVHALNAQMVKLERSIEYLDAICETARVAHQAPKKIRIFESHDEKLKPLMKMPIDSHVPPTVGTIGLVELRSGAALKNMVRDATFGDIYGAAEVDLRTSREYLMSLNKTIDVARQSYVARGAERGRVHAPNVRPQATVNVAQLQVRSVSTARLIELSKPPTHAEVVQSAQRKEAQRAGVARQKEVAQAQVAQKNVDARVRAAVVQSALKARSSSETRKPTSKSPRNQDLGLP